MVEYEIIKPKANTLLTIYELQQLFIFSGWRLILILPVDTEIRTSEEFEDSHELIYHHYFLRESNWAKHL